MASLPNESEGMGKVVAIMTTKSEYGEVTRNIYERQAENFINPLREGVEESYIAGIHVTTTIKFVN
ncbi:hypothetical protein [Bacillus cereus]|uniref:Uncharacterized protein n=1 Tax=Bacillus cereus TaxID=1396 RepID=A0ABD4LLL6_BACCE|nr:hypothetical protein [Bacillus cereus]MBK1611689.1 hypothetical protein [Bacillus cereus]